MSVFADVEKKLADVKGKVEGDLHALTLKLEAIFQRVHQSPIEDVVKADIASKVHDAASHVEKVADTLRSDVDTVDKVVDSADAAVDSAAK
jgi:hypothetical protein